VMRELKRASQTARRGSVPPPEPVPLPEPRRRRRRRPKEPVTTPPRAPTAEPDWLERLRVLARRRPVPIVAVPLSVILLGLLLFRSGAKFVSQPSPVPITGSALPLPIEPGAPIATVFAILGEQPPQPNPDAPSLARYSYGTDLTIDALNGSVYRITLLVPNRSWHGLRVGVPEREVEGTLALLGPPQEAAPPVTPRADTLHGMVAYPSLTQRPTRSLMAQVRPPNGCYDVTVTIQPRAAGVLIAGPRRWAVIGPPRAPPDWVATRIEVTDRAGGGPAGPGAC
jgi:hypothetical protein